MNTHTSQQSGPAGRLKRSVASIVTALALVVTGSVALAPTAGAYEDGSQSGDYDPGSSTGGGSGTGVCKDGNGYIVSGTRNYIHYYIVYARCKLVDSWIYPGRANCPTGWEMWRFWGTDKRGIMGQSLSRVQYSDDDLYDCPSGRAIRSAFFAYHPADAGSSAGLQYPWASPGSRDYRQISPTFASGRPVYVGDPRKSLYGTGPVDASWGVPCSRVADASPDPIPGMLDMGGEVAKAVTANILATYTSAVDTYGKDFARVYANLAGVNLSTGKIRYDDGIPCSSVLDFAVGKDDPLPFVGFCAIPLTHTGVEYRNSRGTQVFSYRAEEHERYEPLNQRPGWVENNKYTREMKDFIYERVKGRVARNPRNHPGADVYTITGVNGRQAWSSVALSTARQYRGSPEQVASSAKRAALCTFTQAARFYANAGGNDGPSLQQGPAPDGVTFTVSSPQVGQVGGRTRVFDVNVSHSPLMCGGVTCAERFGDMAPFLTRVSWNLSIAGSNYTRCASPNQFNCDYYVESISPTFARVWFYRASPQAGGLSIALTDVDVRYRRIVEETISIPCVDTGDIVVGEPGPSPAPRSVTSSSSVSPTGDVQLSELAKKKKPKPVKPKPVKPKPVKPKPVKPTPVKPTPADPDPPTGTGGGCVPETFTERVTLPEEPLPGDQITFVGAPRIVPVIGGVSQPR